VIKLKDELKASVWGNFLDSFKAEIFLIHREESICDVCKYKTKTLEIAVLLQRDNFKYKLKTEYCEYCFKRYINVPLTEPKKERNPMFG